VLRHKGVERAMRKPSASFSRALRPVARCQPDIATRGIKSVWRDVAAFVTSAQRRQPMQLQMKPVRQCARREESNSTWRRLHLYSENAPREVHLWQ
jgi:hypothetical protein